MYPKYTAGSKSPALHHCRWIFCFLFRISSLSGLRKVQHLLRELPFFCAYFLLPDSLAPRFQTGIYGLKMGQHNIDQFIQRWHQKKKIQDFPILRQLTRPAFPSLLDLSAPPMAQAQELNLLRVGPWKSARPQSPTRAQIPYFRPVRYLVGPVG